MLASRCSLSSQQLAGRRQVGAATGLRQHGRPRDFSQSSRSQRGALMVCASGVQARWCIDVEYGHKQTVTGLLQEWVADIGSLAGLKPANTAISSGSVGVAESRLELVVCFGSLSEWEQFLASNSPKEHMAWSQRVQGMIVGGSPRWELFRAVPAFPDAPDAAATTAAIAAPAARPVAPVAALPPAVVSQPSTATAAASSVSSILAAALGNGGPERSYGSSMEVDDAQAAHIKARDNAIRKLQEEIQAERKKKKFWTTVCVLGSVVFFIFTWGLMRKMVGL